MINFDFNRHSEGKRVPAGHGSVKPFALKIERARDLSFFIFSSMEEMASSILILPRVIIMILL